MRRVFGRGFDSRQVHEKVLSGEYGGIFYYFLNKILHLIKNKKRNKKI